MTLLFHLYHNRINLELKLCGVFLSLFIGTALDKVDSFLQSPFFCSLCHFQVRLLLGMHLFNS